MIYLSDICRVFSLYHDRFIYEKDSNQNDKKEYLTIGFFDWFQTHCIELKKSYDLSELYNYIAENNTKISNYESVQNMYGF